MWALVRGSNGLCFWCRNFGRSAAPLEGECSSSRVVYVIFFQDLDFLLRFMRHDGLVRFFPGCVRKNTH